MFKHVTTIIKVTILSFILASAVASDYSALSTASILEKIQVSPSTLSAAKHADTMMLSLPSSALFNHEQQRNIVYVFAMATLLVICVYVLIYRHIKPNIPIPWFLLKIYAKRSRLSGWKESNTQYKQVISAKVFNF